MKELILISCLYVCINVYAQQTSVNVINDSYLGQKSPGMIPEIFVPGLISIEEGAEYGAHFSPDLAEFYFTRNSPGSGAVIWVSKRTNSIWERPKIVDFMYEYPGGESCISPDGKYFFYVWINKTSETAEHDIYRVEKTKNGWNVPERLTEIDLGSRRISPSVASNGNLYYSGDYYKPGQKDIYVSEFVNDNYSTPYNLGEKVNSEYNESHVFVSPDESYLLFDSNRPGGNGKTDIYISIKKKDGSWSKAKKSWFTSQ